MKSLVLSIMLLSIYGSTSHSLTFHKDRAKEFHCKMDRAGGTAAVDHFKKFLREHCPEGMKLNLTAATKGDLIEKFSLRIRSESGFNIKIHSGGFYQFELSWMLDEKNQPYNIWYRFDEREKKAINLEDFIGRNLVKVNYKSV